MKMSRKLAPISLQPNVFNMKFLLKKHLSLYVLCLLFTTAANGQKTYSLKSHKMTIDGTSSMHDWTSDVTKLTWSGSILTEGTNIKEIKNAEVKIQVASIKSTKGKTMDNKTYEAFKSDKNPTITYKLSSLSASGANLQATGSLTMAGSSQSIVMSISAKVLANGDVQLTGTQKLSMKDYKMEPPTAVMGTIKVGDEVIVNFDLVLTPSK
jgi:polyisoprenoid-binding protein YceI